MILATKPNMGMLAIEINARADEKEVEGFNSLTNSESLSYFLLYLFFNLKSKKNGPNHKTDYHINNHIKKKF